MSKFDKVMQQFKDEDVQYVDFRFTDIRARPRQRHNRSLLPANDARHCVRCRHAGHHEAL